MITIKQLEEIIHNTDDTKTIKYIDENNKPIEPNDNSIVEDISYTKDFNNGPFGGTYKTNYVITIKNESDLRNHLDNPQTTLEKHFKMSEETGYYDWYKPDFETICKNFKVYEGTPTLHAYSNYDGDDYRITIFKQDDYYYAYVVVSYDYGGFKNSYVIQNEDYLGLLKDLNEKIYSTVYWLITKILTYY